MEEKLKKLKKGEKCAGISTVVIFLLALAEGFIGFLSGSTVLITDALHNITDSITTFVSWFGLKISQRKPSEKFPYGYYKAESLATLLVSLFILYGVFEMLVAGYSKLFIRPKLGIPFQALGIALVSIIVSYLLANYMKKVGTEVNSQSLMANAQERETHIISSSVVFVTLLLTFYRIPYVEGIVTMIFSLVILKIGIFVAKDSVFALMDISPGKEIERKVKKIINSIAGIEGFKNLKLRRAGPFIFGEVDVKVRKHLDVKRAHEIADKLEDKIKKEVPQVSSFTIHVEPFEAKEQKLALPIKQDKGLNSEIMERFGRASYFIFVMIDKNKGKIKSFYVKKNPYKVKSARAGFATANFITKEKIDVLITKEIGGISLHTLRDHLVDVYKARGKIAKDIVKNFVKNKLEQLAKPTKEIEE